MMRLFEAKKIHCIGIKGAGMTALAELLTKNGVTVTGSDTSEVFFTDAILRGLRIQVKESFAPENIPADCEVIVYSTAYAPERNSELQAAFAGGRTVMSYPEALGLLTQEKLSVAVCGTHGKTTTSALLAHTLKELGLDPSAIIGSQITNWGGNALAGQGKFFVLEADEYQNKLRFYHPLGVILTSIDWDHPDFFPTAAEYQRVFEEFVMRIPRHGFLVACDESAAVRTVAQQTKATKILYGFHEESDVRIMEYVPIDPESVEGKSGFLQRFALKIQNKTYGPFYLRLSGRHNALNAAAVVSVLWQLRLFTDDVPKALESFRGTKRRFEKVGTYRGALLYDDYAHHPDEVRVTLRAFRELYPKRKLRVIFHPHTFTRTKALFEEFTTAFEDATSVTFLDIYGSAREAQGGVSSEELVEAINRYTPNKSWYAPDRARLIKDLRESLRKDDLLVTMGAGDVWQLGEALVHKT